MSGLRCWPGCLAVVNRSKLGVNVGIVVTVGEFAGLGPDGPMWWTYSDRPRPVIGSNTGVIRLKTRGRSPDAWLTPITPPPGTDCTTHDADKPQPVEAA